MATYEDTLGEIDLERAQYLLSADEMLEEMLAGDPDLTTVEKASDGKAEAVCCGVIIGSGIVPAAETVDRFPICGNKYEI